MKGVLYLLPVLFITTLSGCTNFLYQGQLSDVDAYGENRQFSLYWTKTEKLIGRTKAGPAILMTECSPTRISFDEQPEGIIFRGEQGRDRLAGQTATVARDQICGRILNHVSLADAHEGELFVTIACEPMSPDEFDVYPRNYPKARTAPYLIEIIEQTRRWSIFGETLQPGEISCAR